MEANRQVSGRGRASDETVAHYAAWRGRTSGGNAWLLDFYGTWRNGLCNGMGGISLAEILIALDLCRITENERSEIAERILIVHGIVWEIENERHDGR